MGNIKDIKISKLKKSARTSLKGNWGLAVVANLIGGIILSIPNSISTSRTFESLGRLSRYMDVIGNGAYNYSNIQAKSNGGLVFILNLLLTGAITYGLSRFSLNLIREKNPKIEDIFSGFKQYGKTFLINLLLSIFKFLWSLLWLIPAIIVVVLLLAGYASDMQIKEGIVLASVIAAIVIIAAAISLQIFLARYSMAYYIYNDNNEIDAMDSLKKSIELMDGYKIKYFLLNLSFIGWGILSVLTIGIGLLFLFPYIRASEAKFYQEISNNENPVEVIEF